MSRQTRPTTVVSQPREVLDRGRVGAAEPEPRLLHGVVRLGHRPEHAVGDCLQMRSVLLEAARQHVSLVHGHILSSGSVIGLTKRRPAL
jgi:hypothetical protein